MNPNNKHSENCCSTLREEIGGEKECYSYSHSVSQHGKTFELKRKKDKQEKICRMMIDCLLPIPAENQKKCDAMFVRCRVNEMFFVELKGGGTSDVKSCTKQITDSIDWINQKMETSNYKVHGYVIGGKFPRGANQILRKLQDSFRKKYKGKLVRKSGPKHVETI